MVTSNKACNHTSHQPAVSPTMFSSGDVQLWDNGNHGQTFTQYNTYITEMAM